MKSTFLPICQQCLPSIVVTYYLVSSCIINLLYHVENTSHLPKRKSSELYKEFAKTDFKLVCFKKKVEVLWSRCPNCCQSHPSVCKYLNVVYNRWALAPADSALIFSYEISIDASFFCIVLFCNAWKFVIICVFLSYLLLVVGETNVCQN